METMDRQLVNRIAEGDAEAFVDFYDRHAPRVLGMLVNMLRQRADAEDVLQEVFWQVWCNAKKYDPSRSPPEVWLLLLGRSRAVDKLRKRVLNESPFGPEPTILLDPRDAMESNECNCRVKEALAELPDEQRSALTLAFYGGLTNEQVARQEAIPLGTAKTRIRLGMRRLRVLLEPLAYD